WGIDGGGANRGDRVTFLLRDVLSNDFAQVGSFDTVTAIHLLEHLAEDQLRIALTNLLRVTTRRLLVSVPYEVTLQALYGHQQAFTPEKLHLWGQWCVDTLGAGSYRCEDVSGGLLIVDRSTNQDATPGMPID